MRLVVAPECGEIPAHWPGWLTQNVPRGARPIHSPNGVFFLQHTAPNELTLTKAPLAVSWNPPSFHWGHALWKEFHEAAWNGRMTEEWLKEFDARIPSFCACKNPWSKIRSENPFDPTSAPSWSVKLHNFVNAKLNKPTFSFSEALNLYGTPSTTAAPLS